MLARLNLVKPYLKRYRRYMWWGLVAIAISNALGLMAPLVLRRAINRIEHGGGVQFLLWDATLIMLLALGSGVFRFLVRRTVIWASRKIEFDLRADLFAHLLRLDGSFFDRTPTGDIITRASSDVEQVRMMIGPGIMQGVNTLVTAGVAIPLMVHLDWRLALYALLPLPILALLTNLLGGVAHRRLMAIQEAFSRLSGFVQESLAGMRVIRAFANESDKSRRFETDNKSYMRLNMRLIKMYGAYMPLLSMLSGAAVLLVLYFGGKAVIEGRIDLGTLVAFSVYLGELVWPMIALGWVVSLYQRGLVSIKRLETIMKMQPRVADPAPEVAVSPAASGALEFRRLTFSYAGNGNGNGHKEESGRKALEDISFVIRPGETVAIAGATGSGKSTIAHLLWRRYRVADHAMFLGEVDANAIRLADWRARIALVAQEPFMFSDTLSANIAVGSAGMTANRLDEVSHQAALAKDMQQFPSAYETVVGERGITLSGGQKQRVTLARALAAQSEILVLDDAFSAVDAQTEQEILDRLADLFGTRIIILITHRLSTLRRVDRILFLDKGRLVDSGAHDEMLTRGGAYARWVAREALKEELERM
ncbi:MAG: ABC transporter ATP-binding protein [candidate division Zixibacteria bacterium]|nr:ABC transporter ATP-binding protein [candidate division Zixibacteria bacterium]